MRGQIALAIALALVAIGCSSDPSEQATPTAQEQVVDDSQPVEADTEQPIEEEAPVETSTSTTTTELTQNEPTASELSCESVVSPAEIDEAFGTSVQEINGGGGFCNIIYAADFIGGLVIVPADEAQVALDVLVESETGQGRAPQVLSEDGARGFTNQQSIVVITDSGRLINFGVPIPEVLGPVDLDAAIAQMAELLLMR